MIWHSTETDAVLEELGVSRERGLTNSEALERLDKYGKNAIKNIEKPSLKKHFVEQLKDKYCYILIVIAILTSLTCIIDNREDFLSPLLIIAIVLINSFVSAYQMFKSQVALNHLRGIASPVATVLRDGATKQIPSEELVPGDIIMIKSGDYIPADARLIETANLSCNEFALTGSDIPVNKKPDLVLEDITEIDQRNNMVFSGCIATMGSATAVVVETGLYTEMGRSSSIDQQTGEYNLPIQSRLNKTGKLINILIFAVCALVFIIQIIINFRGNHFASMVSSSLLNSLALAVAAIPEGLPAISVIAVALGIERIIREDIIIKKVSALETLGKTTVICSDKTGIITKNSMSVVRIFDGSETVTPGTDALSEKFKTILRVAAGCSTLNNDATETSIEKACTEYTGISANELENLFPRVAVIPFDSARKTMTSINLNDGKPMAIVKGAPEVLADKLINIDSKTLLDANESMALDALRVVCIAYKPLEEIPINPVADDIEKDLIFVGLIGFDDPPRSSTIDAIGICDTAGIRTIMITGDNLTTAKAVARRVGILKDGTQAITGSALAQLSDEELREDIGKFSVFARISPEDKLRIIDALQAKGETVTVTGDDFSDVQALANADIGCAMGRIGSDVARGNADIIIKNSYFSSIVSAVKESRGLFANIQKSVAFLLSCNIAEVAVYLISLLIFKKPIVTATQLLWLNLLTDCSPVIALATAKAEEKVMNKCPVSMKGSLFDNRGVADIVLQSLFITVTTIIAFVIGNGYEESFEKTKHIGMTMAFVVISLSEIFHTFNIRFTHSIFTKEFAVKDYLFISSAFIVLIILFLALCPAGAIFKLSILKFNQIMICLLLSFAIIPFCEIIKILKKRIRR